MTTQEIAQLKPSWDLANATAAGTPIGQSTTAVMQLPIEVRVTRLEGPTTLTLALIGAATLAAYRGVRRRLTSRATAADAVRHPIKPRRRAA
jgi:hypothetical protein